MGRSYFFDRWRPDIPPLGYPPMDECDARGRIPDDWTVWAFADIHGARDGFLEALQEAKLVDLDGHWRGGPNVALVGLGDYIDRGPDSKGVVELLMRLAPELEAAGSRLVLVRGNHEQMLADILRGSPEWFESWRLNGGDALARSYGVPSPSRGVGRLVENLTDEAPDLLPWLLATLPAARWRDIVFVHAGLPRTGTRGTLLIGDRQLWDPDGWFIGSEGVTLEPELWAFRDYGVRRVVIGHYPQDRGPTIDHDGTLLLLDTNASGLRAPSGVQLTAFVTLACLLPDGPLEESEFVMVGITGPRGSRG
jgi:hypothetical protein